MSYFIAFLFSTILSVLLSFLIIPLLKKYKAKQIILHYVESHQYKSGTPTMGGLIFIISSLFMSVLFLGKDNKPALVALLISLIVGIIGFLDDYIKVRYARNLGLKPYQKIISQLVLSLVIGFYALSYTNGEIFIPFFNKTVYIGYFAVPLFAIAFIATVNTVNLTDGLDGLAGMTTIIYFISLGVILFISIFAMNQIGIVLKTKQYQNFLMLIVCIVGALMGFIMTNCFPAKIFMGDTGSMYLGSLIATVSILTKNVLLIALLGLPFVVSGLSDIIQVAYFKLTKGKRVFLMAPFHHHLEKKGLHENRIVAIYSVVSIVVSAIVIAFCFGGYYGI